MIEDVIREAVERGDFDNLPGKGRPLNLAQDPLLDPITSIVNRILRDNGVSHPLIEARRDIEREIEEARKNLRQARNFYRQSRSEDAWSAAQNTFRGAVKAINKQVRTFNLKTPSPALHGLAIDADAEIEQIVAGRNPTRDPASTTSRS
jgi:DnaJ family protein C protein 28